MPRTETKTTPPNAAEARAATEEVARTAPTIASLALHLANVGRAHELFDLPRDDNEAQEARDILYDRADAIRELMASVPPSDLPECAALLNVLAIFAGRLYYNTLTPDEVTELAHKVERMALGILPVVAGAAGLDMNVMGWDGAASLRLHRYAGVGVTQ